MLSQYWDNTRTGLTLFLGVGLALLLPVIAVHYVRFGRVDPRRALALYGFLAYALVAVAQVFLPFPDPATVCRGEQMLNLTPLQWVSDMRLNLATNHRSGLGGALTSSAFLTIAFNVALFMPLGVFLRRRYGRGVLSTVATGFAVSLLFETTQYTGNFGMYACPYRIADVDDLISNTTGALLGWIVAPLVFVLPKVLPRPEVTALPDAAGLPRRAVALGVDLFLFAAAVTLLPGNPWPALGLLALIRVVATPGALLMRYQIRRTDGSPAWWRLAVREVVGVTGVCAYLTLFPVPRQFNWLVDPLVIAYAVVGLLVVPAVRRDQRGWHELLSGTRTALVSSDPTHSRSSVHQPAN